MLVSSFVLIANLENSEVKTINTYPENLKKPYLSLFASLNHFHLFYRKCSTKLIWSFTGDLKDLLKFHILFYP